MFGGKVIVGDGLGKTLGYPTANLDTTRQILSLAPGVYVAKAILDKQEYQAALAIQAEPWKVEVNLLDYVGSDFYGAWLKVEPLERVGAMEKIVSLEALKEKIARDIAIIKTKFVD